MSLIPKGTYRARAVNAKLGQGKNAPQVGIEFELLGDAALSGRRISYYGSFSDAAMEFTLRALRTCGWRGDDVSSLIGITDNEVSLVIDQEEWEGKTRNKVKWVNPLGGLAMKAELAEDEAKKFAAKMRGKVAAFNKSEGLRPAAKLNGKDDAGPPLDHLEKQDPTQHEDIDF